VCFVFHLQKLAAVTIVTLPRRRGCVLVGSRTPPAPTKYLDAISTGTMAQYAPTLRYFSGGDLPIVYTV
jgi:hypothetical protein